MRNIEEKEFNEWLTHPVTVAVKEMFDKRAKDLMLAWSQHTFAEISTAEAYALRNIGEVGRCSVCLEVAALSYEDYLTENHNDERVGLVPEGESSVD